MSKTKPSIEIQIREDAKTQLYQWVIGEKRCITVPYFTRHTKVKPNEAVKLMEEFYQENDDKRLYASYAILAQTKSKVDDKRGFLCKKMIIAKETELETVKSSLEHINSVQIYSVQSYPIDDLRLLTNTDWDDVPKEEKQMTRLEDRSGSREVSIEPGSSAQRSIVQVDKNRKIDAMFAASRNKKASPKKTSPKKPSPKKTPLKSPLKMEPEDDGTPAKKRRPKIVIGNEGESDEVTRPTETTSKSTPKKDSNFDEFVNQSNDLFCTEESPVKAKVDFMEVEEPKETTKTKNQRRSTATKKAKSAEKNHHEAMEVDEAPALRTSRISTAADDDVIEPKRIIRHAKVTETFIDDDGYMVTTQVNKPIETDEITVPTKRPILQPKLANVTATANEKKKTKAPPQGQSKISSFFAKK